MATNTPLSRLSRTTRIRLRIPHADLVAILFGGDDTANHRSNWFALLGIALAIILLSTVFGVGCKPKPPVIVPSPSPSPSPTVEPTPEPTPTPTPTPTPSTPPPTFSELRLTTDGSLFVRASDPIPGYRMRKCVSCCRETVGTGWPGLSLKEIDFLYNQGLCNLVHWRVGPFTSRNEPEWEWTGGGAYIEDPVTGKADLTQFNQPYWDALRAAVIYAGERRMNVEVSLLDGWSVKTKCWRSNAAPGETCAWHPWHPAGNIQGIDHLSTSWQGTDPSPVHLAYLAKVFETVGDLENVIIEDGTEPDQLVKVDGRTDTDIVRWSLTQEALLRQYEAAHSLPRHLYGTNFPGDASLAWLRKGRFEYQNIHRMSASATPYVANTFFDPSDFVRPLVMDEYNPEPPMLALDVEAFACYTAERGAYWGAWRHDQDVNQWKATLSLIARDSIDGCSEKMKTGCPYDILPVMRVDCKRHAGNLYDCTPKNGQGKPILQEGKIARGLCEQSAAGMGAGEGVVWSATPQNAITVFGTANRWQFKIAGAKGAKGTLHCKLPKIADACNALALEVQ